MVSASSYSGEVPAAFYGFDTARFLISLVEELLLFGDKGVYGGKSVRADNSSVVEHAHSIRSVTNERALNSSQRVEEGI